MLGQRPKPANDHHNSEPDEERHDRQPRPCDAWQLHRHSPLRSPLESLAYRSPLERSEFSQAASDVVAFLGFGSLGLLVALVTLAGLLILVGIFGMPVFDLG